MSGLLSRFLREDRAATGAEFALVLPLALLFLFGIIDAGRYGWMLNQLEKGAQMGARYAVVTNPVEGGLASDDFLGSTACNGGEPLTAGDPICKAAFGTTTCTSAGCTCATGPCAANPSFQSAAFNAILARVQVFAPSVAAANLVVEYQGSGIGYASDPDIALAPLVTVRIKDMQFPAFAMLGGAVDLPDISRSLLMEDGVGTKAN